MSRLRVPVTAEDHIQGNLNAECNLVEYGDYQCPYCGAAYPIVKKILSRFGKRLCFVFRNFPMSQLHPWAETAAEVSEFAGAQGKFWEMHDRLFENQESLGDALFMRLALALKLPQAEMEAAIAQHTFLARVRADFAGGARSGVNGTPTFFINGQRYNGSVELRSLGAVIEQEMAASKAAHH